MKYIFQSNFYTIYQAPNADDLIKFIGGYDETSIDNSQFNWGKMCSSDKISLRWEDCMELLTPSINLFSKEFNVNFNYALCNSWINFYKRGDHQEVHGHPPNHLSGVFIANDGEEFSQFYFLDKDNYAFSDPYSIGKIINHNSTHIVELKAGDIMFFPSYMLHGVTPHKSDIIRKSLSFNLDLMNVVTNDT